MSPEDQPDTPAAPPVAPKDPRRALMRPDLADSALRGLVQAEAWVDPVEMEVQQGLVPLLSAPGAAGLAAQLRRGDRVRVAELADGMAWLQRARDGYVGWAPAAALTNPQAAEFTHKVTAPLTHLYPQPSIKTVPLDALPMGVRLRGAEQDGFLAVAGGFVPLSALGAEGLRAQDPTGVAEGLLGVPYLWGGESWSGIDCSGLVQLSLEAAGIPAPRDSDMQAEELGRALPNPWSAAGPAAAAPPLRRGDLVFWRGHVGIMRDARILLHANAHHMRVAAEPLATAVARIAASGGAGRGAGLPIALRRP